MRREVYESIFFVTFGFVGLCVLSYIASISFNLTTVDMYVFMGLGVLSIIIIWMGTYMFVSEMLYAGHWTVTTKEGIK
jgi:hypothetical protein